MREDSSPHFPLTAEIHDPPPPAHRGPARLELLIVSGSDETRTALHRAAETSDLFRSVIAMADGRFALEHLGNSLAEGGPALPEILIADCEMVGLRVTQLLRAIRQAEPMRRMLVAVFAPDAPPNQLDAIESSGSDLIIRGGQSLASPTKLFRTLVYRHAAKTDPPGLTALNLSCGALGGCGVDVPAIA